MMESPRGPSEIRPDLPASCEVVPAAGAGCVVGCSVIIGAAASAVSAAGGDAVPVRDVMGGRSGAVGSAPESGVLVCAPPAFCTIPVRGSSVAVEPNDVVPVALVELAVDVVGDVSVAVGSDVEVCVDERVELDDDVDDGEPAGGELETGSDEDVESDAVEFESDGEDDDEESGEDEEELESGSAHAMPGVVATAIPMPSAIAKAPTRPMYLALPIARLCSC